MAFRKGSNRHDAWVAYRAKIAAGLEAVGLPPVVFRTEQAFVEFLTAGRRADVPFDLDALSEPQYLKLFDLATSWFDDRAGAFTALECRRLGRGRTTPGADGGV